MELTEKTIGVLSNFNGINKSICISPGNVIKTISYTNTVIAKAEVDMEFDKEFCLYDIARFLNVLNLMKTTDIEVEKKHIIIRNNKSKIDYVCASKDLIKSAPDKMINMPKDCICHFNLKADDIQQLLQAMAILGLPEIAIIGENGSLDFKGIDSDGKIQDTYSLTIGETDKNFKVVIKTGNFTKIMPGDYEVRIANVKGVNVSQFKNDKDNVEYFIAIDKASNI